MNTITLSKEEASIILSALGNATVSELADNLPLFNAIARLAGVNSVSNDTEMWWVYGADKIRAIKTVRELTGVGLKEAKDYVEGTGVVGAHYATFDNNWISLSPMSCKVSTFTEAQKHMLVYGMVYDNVLRRTFEE